MNPEEESHSLVKSAQNVESRDSLNEYLRERHTRKCGKKEKSKTKSNSLASEDSSDDNEPSCPAVEQTLDLTERNHRSSFQLPIENEFNFEPQMRTNSEIRREVVSLRIALAARKSLLNEIQSRIKKANRILSNRFSTLTSVPDLAISTEQFQDILRSHRKLIRWLSQYTSRGMEDISKFEQLKLCPRSRQGQFNSYIETNVVVDGVVMNGVFIPIPLNGRPDVMIPSPESIPTPGVINNVAPADSKIPKPHIRSKNTEYPTPAPILETRTQGPETVTRKQVVKSNTHQVREFKNSSSHVIKPVITTNQDRMQRPRSKNTEARKDINTEGVSEFRNATVPENEIDKISKTERVTPSITPRKTGIRRNPLTTQGLNVEDVNNNYAQSNLECQYKTLQSKPIPKPRKCNERKNCNLLNATREDSVSKWRKPGNTEILPDLNIRKEANLEFQRKPDNTELRPDVNVREYPVLEFRRKPGNTEILPDLSIRKVANLEIQRKPDNTDILHHLKIRKDPAPEFQRNAGNAEICSDFNILKDPVSEVRRQSGNADNLLDLNIRQDAISELRKKTPNPSPYPSPFSSPRIVQGPKVCAANFSASNDCPENPVTEELFRRISRNDGLSTMSVYSPSGETAKLNNIFPFSQTDGRKPKQPSLARIAVTEENLRERMYNFKNWIKQYQNDALNPIEYASSEYTNESEDDANGYVQQSENSRPAVETPFSSKGTHLQSRNNNQKDSHLINNVKNQDAGSHQHFLKSKNSRRDLNESDPFIGETLPPIPKTTSGSLFLPMFCPTAFEPNMVSPNSNLKSRTPQVERTNAVPNVWDEIRKESISSFPKFQDEALEQLNTACDLNEIVAGFANILSPFMESVHNQTCGLRDDLLKTEVETLRKQLSATTVAANPNGLECYEENLETSQLENEGNRQVHRQSKIPAPNYKYVSPRPKGQGQDVTKCNETIPSSPRKIPVPKGLPRPQVQQCSNSNSFKLNDIVSQGCKQAQDRQMNNDKITTVGKQVKPRCKASFDAVGTLQTKPRSISASPRVNPNPLNPNPALNGSQNMTEYGSAYNRFGWKQKE